MATRRGQRADSNGCADMKAPMQAQGASATNSGTVLTTLANLSGERHVECNHCAGLATVNHSAADVDERPRATEKRRQREQQ